MIEAIAGLLLLFALCLLLCLVFVIKKQRFGYRKPALKPRIKRESARSSHPASAGNVPQPTQKHLMSLLHGNRDAVERLLEQVRKKYPDKSEAWCWDKVILDLERDRR